MRVGRDSVSVDISFRRDRTRTVLLSIRAEHKFYAKFPPVSNLFMNSSFELYFQMWETFQK